MRKIIILKHKIKEFHKQFLKNFSVLDNILVFFELFF